MESFTPEKLFALANKLWPINRSITGKGFMDSLKILEKNGLEGITLISIPSGTKVFDWTVPLEWNVKDAYIVTPSGKKICDFKENNLHLLGYSIPTKSLLALADLQKNLYSLADQPDAIPYVTSYYEKKWGFCISKNERERLEEGMYEVFIDSSLENGTLNYGELYIPGNSKQEVLISTYLCHPSMANNELSGPVVISALASWIRNMPSRKYSYRFVIIPETIGSIAFLSKNLVSLKKNVIAGFNVTCIGDNRDYSYLPSRNGKTLSDRVAKNVLTHFTEGFTSYSWNDRGSDERQYCSPGVDLPVASIMRTKYGNYPEYHTSLDTLGDVVTPEGLWGGFQILLRAIETIEANCYPRATNMCEPQLGMRNLYPNTSKKGSYDPQSKLLQNVLTWSDGFHDLIDISEKINVPALKILEAVEILSYNNLVIVSGEAEGAEN